MGLHSYAVSTHPDELVFELPPKKNPGSAYAAASSTRIRPAPPRKAVRVPAPAPQMRVPATRAGQPAPCRTLMRISASKKPNAHALKAYFT